MLHTTLMIIHFFAAAGIVSLVLLQRGKGAEAGAGFGAGASGTVFGARGATTALSRATAVFAAIFMVNSLALAYMGTKSSEVQQNTLLEEAAQTHPQQPAVAPGSATPGHPAPAGQPPASAPASAPVTPAPTPPK